MFVTVETFNGGGCPCINVGSHHPVFFHHGSSGKIHHVKLLIIYDLPNRNLKWGFICWVLIFHRLVK